MKINTDEQKIEKLLTRGVEQVFPSTDFLREKLKEGKQLTIYHGIDPTGPTLHLGHGVQLLKFRDFQELGHKVILLIGDFTAMIGDPTDKSATRVKLTRDEVLKNAKDYKEQASKILNFDGDNPAELKYNSEWLSKLSFAELLGLASNVTVQQILKRDMFQERIKKEKDVFLHEFLYPIMQGYDCVFMGVDGEFGGNDQMFNMLVGRDLMKKLKGKEKFVMTTKLLEDATGTKMGKTEGNMSGLNESAENMFGQIMSWPDGLILPGFELCTRVEIPNEITNPMEQKKKLAFEIVKIHRGEKKAEKAQKHFEQTFQKKENPDEAPEVATKKGVLLADVLVGNGFAKSKSDFRRLVEQGAVKFEGEKITDPTYKIESSGVIKIGPHRFLKTKVK